MSLDEDLDRLKKADPETYKKFSEEAIGEYSYMGYEGDIEIEDIFECDLKDTARRAILQAVLQDAISNYRSEDHLQDRFWKIEQLDKNAYRATIYNRLGRIAEADRDSPAEALLAAYLAAIEGKHEGYTA